MQQVRYGLEKGMSPAPNPAASRAQADSASRISRHYLLAATALMAQTAAHADAGGGSIRDAYELARSVQEMKYSPTALETCRNAAEAAERLAQSHKPPVLSEGPVAGLLELTDPAEAASTRKQIKGLTEVIRSIAAISGDIDQSTSYNDLEVRLREHEAALVELPFEPVFWALHTRPSGTDVFRSYLLRNLIAHAYLDLSKARSAPAWKTLDGQSLPTYRATSSAFENTKRARSLVSPWCNWKLFAEVELESQDLSILYSLFSHQRRFESEQMSARLADHVMAAETLLIARGQQEVLEERLKLSDERSKLISKAAQSLPNSGSR